MNPYRSYRLHITPLSPVHIGTGQSYEPTNYVIEDGILHEFDTGSVLETFSAQDRQGLLDIANRRPDGGMLKSLQSYFFERRHALAAGAVNRIPVLSGVGALYADRVGQTAQREGDGGQVLNKLEIDRTAFDPISRKPVLFGSSVKGAIRTALLDRENKGNRAREKKGLHDFQGRLFEYYDPEGRPKMALERDPLRLVQLADAHWHGEALLPAAQIHLAVNRKKAPVMDHETGQLRPAMGENLYQILECVPPWHYRAFTGQVNLQRIDGIRQQNGLPAADKRYSMETITQSCNRFYLPILSGERKLLRERGYGDTGWDRAVQQTLQAAQTKIQTGTAFLLRVGRHSGAESVTVSGARNGKIRIMKGQPPEFADAAKTLWLAADRKDQQTGMLPFGWLLVEIQPLEAPEQDWPELQALCEPHLQQARGFADRLARQREQFEKARAEAEVKCRAEEQAARLEAEKLAKAAREEAEDAARLATLSENARRVEDLKALRNQGNKGRGKGDRLFQLTTEFIKSAGEWPVEDRHVLRSAAVKIFEHLGLKKDDYKKLVRDLAQP